MQDLLNAAPSAPTNLRATVVTSNSVQFQWTAPFIANGVIIHYTVEVTDNITGEISSANVNTMAAEALGLTSCGKYSIAVSATTACDGCTGPLSDAISLSVPANSVINCF